MSFMISIGSIIIGEKTVNTDTNTNTIEISEEAATITSGINNNNNTENTEVKAAEPKDEQNINDNKDADFNAEMTTTKETFITETFSNNNKQRQNRSSSSKHASTQLTLIFKHSIKLYNFLIRKVPHESEDLLEFYLNNLVDATLEIKSDNWFVFSFVEFLNFHFLKIRLF